MKFGGKPMIVGGKPMKVGGKPMKVGGKPSSGWWYTYPSEK